MGYKSPEEKDVIKAQLKEKYTSPQNTGMDSYSALMDPLRQSGGDCLYGINLGNSPTAFQSDTEQRPLLQL